MKLGLLTAAFPDLSLEEVAAWAAGEGFEALEIACWPGGAGERRRYAGVTHIDVDSFDPGEVKDVLARNGLEISALAYYPNNLHPDDAHRDEVNAHLRKVVDAAAQLGVEVVGTFVGNDKDRPLRENLERFARIWPDLVRHAADQGVKIAIENCPMIFSEDEWPGGNNLAWSPAIWEQMFETIPDESFGLNLDPSHLVWLMIDYERAVYDFADRIFHVHAKDLEVRRDGLYRHGTLSAGMGWQVPRLPWARRGRLGPVRRGALRGRVRPLDLGRARGPPLRGGRGARQARLPRRAEHAPAAARLSLRTVPASTDLDARVLSTRGRWAHRRSDPKGLEQCLAVPRRSIIGRVDARYWPPNRAGEP